MESRDNSIPYEVIRSRRSTADVIIERDGSVLVRVPEWVSDEQVETIVESKHYWSYQSVAEWRDLNATRVLREYKNGEGFLYLGRAPIGYYSSTIRESRCSSRTAAFAFAANSSNMMGWAQRRWLSETTTSRVD